jgi:hypothetical protein
VLPTGKEGLILKLNTQLMLTPLDRIKEEFASNPVIIPAVFIIGFSQSAHANAATVFSSALRPFAFVFHSSVFVNILSTLTTPSNHCS